MKRQATDRAAGKTEPDRDHFSYLIERELEGNGHLKSRWLTHRAEAVLRKPAAQ